MHKMKPLLDEARLLEFVRDRLASAFQPRMVILFVAHKENSDPAKLSD